MSSAAVTAGTSSRRPVKTTRPEIPSEAAWASSESRSEPSPTMSSQASGWAARTSGQASMQSPVALLGLQASHDADDRRASGDRVVLVERAARLLVVVALQVDAVVDQADRRAGAALVADLLLDRLRDDDQPIHQRRQLAQGLAVVGAADAARMDGRDHGRPAAALLSEQQRGPGADHLGPDTCGCGRSPARTAPSSLGQRLDGQPSSGSSMTADVDAGLLQPADAAAVRERDDADVVAGRVEPRDERVDVLLRAAVGAGGHDLDDAHAPAVERLARRPARSAQGSPRPWSAPISSCLLRGRPVPAPLHEQALDRRVDRAPLVLVGLVAAQEVEAGSAELDGSLDVAGDHDHSGGEISGVRLDARVVVVDGLAVVEGDSGRDAAAADGQEAEIHDAGRRAILEQPGEEAAAGGSALGRREEALGAPALLVQVDEGVQVVDRGSPTARARTSPAASARRTLRRISWRSFLPSVPR